MQLYLYTICNLYTICIATKYKIGNMKNMYRKDTREDYTEIDNKCSGRGSFSEQASISADFC